MIKMLDLSKQYEYLQDEINRAIHTVLESGTYILGSRVRTFENAVASYLNVDHAIGVASGSDALLLSLHAIGLKPGDAVLVPAFTFFATAGAVCRLGGVPIFIDIDPDSYNIDCEHVRKALDRNPNVKAIIPVHVFGLPCNMGEIMKLARERGLFVIEDACQAINADVMIDGTNAKAGTIADTGCFSFYPTKNLSCFGDGGMVVTNDDKLADRIRLLRKHGADPKYYHKEVGYNSRLDEIQAAILSVKLKYLSQWTMRRQELALYYNDQLSKHGLTNIVKVAGVTPGHVFHQYSVQISDREGLAKYLLDHGVESSIYYPHPLHLQECFVHLGYEPGDLPVAEAVCKQILSLPMYPELLESDIDYIVSAIADYYGN